MAMYKTLYLPFEVERACRCSFVVRLCNGEHAFITNENLLYMTEHPDADFQIVERLDSRGICRKWIVVAKIVWDFGFKKKRFDCNGQAI